VLRFYGTDATEPSANDPPTQSPNPYEPSTRYRKRDSGDARSCSLSVRTQLRRDMRAYYSGSVGPARLRTRPRFNSYAVPGATETLEAVVQESKGRKDDEQAHDEFRAIFAMIWLMSVTSSKASTSGHRATCSCGVA